MCNDILSPIQSTIAEYMRGKTKPSQYDLQCFAGMIQTGEAVYADFFVVGGRELLREVKIAVRNYEDV
jgi:hypothetical protein